MQELAATKLGGPRFSALIRRHEMNIEPPPKEEEKVVDKSVASSHLHFAVLTVPRPVPGGPRRWGQGRLLEAEEEDYFNADDDEDEPFGASIFPGNGKNTLKRKRARSSSIPPMRPQQSPLARTAALGSLLDYDDGDDLSGPSAEDEPFNAALASGPPAPSPQQDIPASPRIAHRMISIGKPTPDVPEDPEDSLLESLVSGADPPSPSLGKPEPGDLGVGLKRRREEDDDELLERLASKAKKPSATSSPGATGKEKTPASGVVFKLGGVKTSEEGPKKIKLKLSSPSPTPAPSSPGAKDGDTG